MYIQTNASGIVRQGRRHGPSIVYKITPCWVTFPQPARRAAVLGQPSAFGLNRFYLRSASSRCPISEVFGEKYELKPKFNPKMAHFESFSSERFFERSIVYVCMDAFPPKNMVHNKIGLPPGF